MHSKQTNQLYTRLNTTAFATCNGIQFVAAAMCLVIVLLASRRSKAELPTEVG